MYETPGSSDSNSMSVANGFKTSSTASTRYANDDITLDDEENTSIWSKSSPTDIVNYYEAIGNWNRTLPKTDYTYSPASVFYNKEIAPGIPTIPNMSRVTIEEFKKLRESWTNSQPSYCVYGTDIDPDVTFRPPDNERITTKIRKVVIRVFIWLFSRLLYVDRLFRSVSTVFNIIVQIARSVKNYCSSLVDIITYSFYSIVSRRRTKFLYFLLPLSLAVAFGFFFAPRIDLSKNLLLDHIPTFEVDNALLRVPNVSARSVFLKIGFVVQDIVQSGIDVPLLIIKTLLFHLVDVITACGVLTVNRLRYYTFDLLRGVTEYDYSERPAHEVLGDRLNYTKLAEALLSVNGFKETLESRSFKLKSAKFDLDELAVELKEIIERTSKTDEVNTRTTLLEKIIGNYAENITRKILQENQFYLLTNSYRSSENYVTESRLNDIVRNLTNDFRNLFDRSEADIYSSTNSVISAVNFTFFEAYINRSIETALKRYDADKTGLVDYALETSGGVILNTRCTETLKSPVSFTVLNIPLWRMQTNPRIVIQPGVHPGQCWAFAGSIGFLVIQLSQKIRITGFTLEHIPKLLAPNGVIDSAPKEFSVWGLVHETKLESQSFLGRFKYDADDSIQYFAAEKNENAFQMVELRIESNHGKIEYTCIYRFRVHGVPFK